MPPARPRFKLTGKDLFLCDMRPGFSEDGLTCTLPKGDYELTIEPTANAKLRGFSLILAGATPTSEQTKGTVSLDMARLGVLDRRAFLAHFGGDAEALFDWSADATDSKSKASTWGDVIRHKKSGLEALYINIGSDCQCSVRLLRSGKKTVGLRVVPQPPPERSAETPGSRYWTWVTIKCNGLGDTWDFCDDRDYEPELEDVLDNVIFEVCSDEDSDSKTAQNRPIAHYQPRFKGVSRITVQTERRDEKRKPLAVPNSYKLPKLGARTTPRQLAEAIFKIFENARKWT
jgi:hypothetical protein